MNISRKNYPGLKVPSGAYYHSVRANSFLYLSGFTAGGTPAENGDIVAQTESILEQIKTILEAESLGFEHIVKVAVYVTELDRLGEVSEVRVRYFGDTWPASTLVKVAGLVLPNLKIEIEAVVLLPD
ncbi:MAG: RidA family protein [SAR202 cluster bacterium]|jgi:2-iminobutanoate/2-iminopropanoate deaminase|nr:RidA family protein [SAR202 cluster bacterium]